MPEENKAPSNSFTQTSLDRVNEPPKPTKITTGKTQIHKKSLGQKFLDAIVPSDLGKVFEHIVYDILAEKAKDIILDSVESLLDRTPTRNAGRSSTPRPGQYVSYSSQDALRRSSPMPTQRNVTDNIIFDTPQDANAVLDALYDYLRSYPQVTVGYLYGLMGYQSDMTKENYGWYSLEGSAIIKTRDGYLLQLPKPVLLGR